jgi:DNA-binding CsgD family transcriptional regulator
MNEDWIHILETAYDLEGDDAQWLAAVAKAARPGLDRGRGVVAYFFDASEPRLKIFGYCSAGADEGSLELARRTHELPVWQSSELLRATYHSPSALTDSVKSLGSKRLREFARGLSESGTPLPRIMILNVADPSHRGCVLGALDPGAPSNLMRRRAPWSRVAAHLAAGLRLRRRLADAEKPAENEEAVLSPGGVLLHAEGAAKERTARAFLRDAAVAVDKARGRLRRSDPDAALELWRGLLEGRWSLVDRFDSDGRRFMVAHRNEPATRGLRALTLRERQVAAYAALAHPNKLIAYELGLSLGSVSSHLHSALAKLGLASRVELVQLASSLGATKRQGRA